MTKNLVFAVSEQDARAYAEGAGVEFDEAVWVMNAQLLGGGDFSRYAVHYTDTFRKMPAFAEAARAFQGQEVNRGRV
ncbi:hypothetical protein [Arthrobacter woluwensis]|uniref:hypothetical protein n=1 Tax=Arthrobacter woluwensis TaxID=156980 RepID=UPI001AAFA544|nr:hypothetical protein [Arthrobacter woluwensis]QTF70615.1 hypothetical protein G8758_00245 [Arthrobacter woluwensis]